MASVLGRGGNQGGVDAVLLAAQKGALRVCCLGGSAPSLSWYFAPRLVSMSVRGQEKAWWLQRKLVYGGVETLGRILPRALRLQ
tara:strand:- start:1931 stop:2182 length:252 start_codon:yes stop_codon:yes gene_type:complete